MNGYEEPDHKVQVALRMEHRRILQEARRLQEPHRRPGTEESEYSIPIELLRAILAAGIPDECIHPGVFASGRAPTEHCNMCGQDVPIRHL